MKIALIGYGRMGREIEKIALSRGHVISGTITTATSASELEHVLRSSDAAIEFTRPDAAVKNIYNCFNAGIPVVTGTTGWYDNLEKVQTRCMKNGNSFLYASNFSLGVNILFAMNKKLARIMNNYPDYNVAIEEIHHAKKLDAPSGTAITLVNEIIGELESKNKWHFADENEIHDSVPVKSVRTGESTGTHIIQYVSDNDMIELKHEAFNRSGFASGAVMAAEWLLNKKGFYTMSDVLNLNS